MVSKFGQENDNSISNSRPTTPFDESGVKQAVLFQAEDAKKEESEEFTEDATEDATSSASEDVASNETEDVTTAGAEERRARIGLNSDGSCPSPVPPPPETEEERIERENAESEELCRQLMAEEAMASYAIGAEYLRDNASQFSGEDLAALQAVMMEEDPEAEEELGEDGDGEMSYETMLDLGERIGDVKQERWKLRAQAEIEKLPESVYEEATMKGKEANDSDFKCLVCQCEYEDGEELRKLPCKHVFHKECIDEWLGRKDCCAYCKVGICGDE
jgi:hypothetical protein